MLFIDCFVAKKETIRTTLIVMGNKCHIYMTYDSTCIFWVCIWIGKETLFHGYFFSWYLLSWNTLQFLAAFNAFFMFRPDSSVERTSSCIVRCHGMKSCLGQSTLYQTCSIGLFSYSVAFLFCAFTFRQYCHAYCFQLLKVHNDLLFQYCQLLPGFSVPRLFSLLGFFALNTIEDATIL